MPGLQASQQAGYPCRSLDWIALGATSGEAGSVELPLLINKNRTGEDRVAVISIYCRKYADAIHYQATGVLRKNGSNAISHCRHYAR